MCKEHVNKPSNEKITVQDGRPCCHLFRLATREGLVTIETWLQSHYGFGSFHVFKHFQMQTVLDFGPVLFARFSKYCLWISSKHFSSPSGYSSRFSGGQTSGEIVKWMGEHAPVFAVNGRDISVLHEPNQFFTALKVRSLNYVHWLFFWQFRYIFHSLYFRTMLAKPNKGLFWLHCTWALGKRSNNL